MAHQMQRRTYLRLLAAGTVGSAATEAGSDYMVGATQAQTSDDGWEQTATLPIERAQEDAFFGQAIAYDGEKALVGEDDIAHVYTKASDGAWRREAELTTESDYGPLVEWMGDAALVSGGPATLYVFEEQGDEWQRTAELAIGDKPDSFNEHSVASTDQQVVLGVAGATNADNIRTGTAYVFEHDDGDWTQETQLLPDDLGEHDAFGTAAAGADGHLLVGAVGQDTSDGEFAGAVYAFETQGDDWVQSTKLVADDASGHEYFGADIALDGDRAVIGSLYAHNQDGKQSGAAYVFERSGSEWSQVAKLAADDSNAQERFGQAVAIDGDTVIAGAPYEADPNGQEAGAAYAFQHTDQWEQTTKLLPDDGNEQDHFGLAVTVDGQEAIIGAPHKEGPSTDGGGKAYVFNGGDAAAATEPGLTDTETAHSPEAKDQGDDMDPYMPWGIGAALAGLGGIGYLLKRRRDGDS